MGVEHKARCFKCKEILQEWMQDEHVRTVFNCPCGQLNYVVGSDPDDF